MNNSRILTEWLNTQGNKVNIHGQASYKQKFTELDNYLYRSYGSHARRITDNNFCSSFCIGRRVCELEINALVQKDKIEMKFKQLGLTDSDSELDLEVIEEYNSLEEILNELLDLEVIHDITLTGEANWMTDYYRDLYYYNNYNNEDDD